MMDHTQTSLDSYICKRPHPSTVMSLQKLNKRLRKPGWHPQLWANCVGGCSKLVTGFLNGLPSKRSEAKGAGYYGTQPSRPVQPCCGKTWQSKRLLSVTFVQSRSSGKLLSSLEFIFSAACEYIPTRNIYAVTQLLLTRRNFLFLNSLRGFLRSLVQRSHFFYSLP